MYDVILLISVKTQFQPPLIPQNDETSSNCSAARTSQFGFEFLKNNFFSMPLRI